MIKMKNTNPATKIEDKDMLFLLHLSQLFNLITGFGGLIFGYSKKMKYRE